MNTETGSTARDEHFVDNMVESALRIGLIFLLLIWTYEIIKPFVIPIIWGAIIAVALMYAYRNQLRANMYLFYGIGGLFLMGLGIRAVLVGAA